MSSTQISISVRELTKTFNFFNKPCGLLLDFLLPGRKAKEFKALDNVTFDVKKGEVVGIIGTNGAGKSTLLKILAGTLDKTSGEVEINGKVGAILELGTGFHEEYTGRENLYMGGIVLGMKREEIEQKIDSMINFSGIGDFIDQPFRTYSSGMRARLTFSLAISQNPEILIIDEALAAGDAIFVEKCLKRIKEVCASDTTVLFVSHSLEMLQLFCKRGLWLHEGKLILDGNIHTAAKAYQRFVYEQTEFYLNSKSNDSLGLGTAKNLIEHAIKNGPLSLDGDSDFFKYGGGHAIIKNFKIIDRSGKGKKLFLTGEYLECVIEYERKCVPEGWDLLAGCQVFNDKGLLMFSPNLEDDLDSDTPGKLISDKGKVRIILDPLYLGPGEYSLTPMLTLRNGGRYICADSHDRVYYFKVKSSKYKYDYILEHPVRIKLD